MNAQVTKTRNMLVRFNDGTGKILTEVFPIELPEDLNQFDFDVERLRIAKKLIEDYPGMIIEYVYMDMDGGGMTFQRASI